MRKPAFHISVLNSVNGIIRMLRSERNFQLEINDEELFSALIAKSLDAQIPNIEASAKKQRPR